ncbi:hypothetical protein EB796_007436 [Bugula neritina]|uniref:Uncharacterized protein n=1 Tax=Bugula neritina TaxID=10212 RepID=A0A7J7K7U6_BUGNE|nr:hypothetical protein EB796_007436 [Bugula neritina]
MQATPPDSKLNLAPVSQCSQLIHQLVTASYLTMLSGLFLIHYSRSIFTHFTRIFPLQGDTFLADKGSKATMAFIFHYYF